MTTEWPVIGRPKRRSGAPPRLPLQILPLIFKLLFSHIPPPLPRILLISKLLFSLFPLPLLRIPLLIFKLLFSHIPLPLPLILPLISKLLFTHMLNFHPNPNTLLIQSFLLHTYPFLTTRHFSLLLFLIFLLLQSLLITRRALFCQLLLSRKQRFIRLILWTLFLSPNRRACLVGFEMQSRRRSKKANSKKKKKWVSSWCVDKST